MFAIRLRVETFCANHQFFASHISRCSVKRTQVIDDESDYFNADDRWLNAADKEKLRKREEELRAQRHASRRDRKVTLDFAGRRVIEVRADVVSIEEVSHQSPPA